MKISVTLTPLGKLYDGFRNPELIGMLIEFSRLRNNDPAFFSPRVDVIEAILRARGIDPSAPTLVEEVAS